MQDYRHGWYFVAMEGLGPAEERGPYDSEEAAEDAKERLNEEARALGLLYWCGPVYEGSAHDPELERAMGEPDDGFDD